MGVSSGTGLPVLSRKKTVKRLCVCQFPAFSGSAETTALQNCPGEVALISDGMKNVKPRQRTILN